MLDQQKAYSALQKKREMFYAYLENHQQQRKVQQEQIDAFLQIGYHQLLALLARGEAKWPGAIPTAEFDQAQGLSMQFAPCQRIVQSNGHARGSEPWVNHQDAREWALEVLMNRPVIAVDGSQISPNLDLATPVGAVQIGWFVNQHSQEGTYVKDLDFEVFLPQDLLNNEPNASQELDYANRRINQERFERECSKLCDLMASYGNRPDDEKPLCFFDGSFIISFAGQLRPELGAPYLGSIRKLLDTSQKNRVPLVGFVDNPHSRDVAKLIEFTLSQRVLVQGIPNQSASNPAEGRLSDDVLAHDAELLGTKLLAQNWGARSPLFICARDDALSREDVRTGDGRASFYRTVCFTYLRLTQDRLPARIELPKWLVDEGRADEILDLVRAECIIGLGYPYAIETADALAVISHRDRERFYGMIQQSFPEINLTQSRKVASKQTRR
ncbi:MAG: DNA double-strand break repair nuclease NurA [Chloroflexota bacterium]